MIISESEPTLRELSELPVVDCWYRLGIQLGVTEDDLDTIEQNYPRDAKICRLKMFGSWLGSDTSATYAKLIKALVEVGKPSLAEKLRRKYGMCACLYSLQFQCTVWASILFLFSDFLVQQGFVNLTTVDMVYRDYTSYMYMLY